MNTMRNVVLIFAGIIVVVVAMGYLLVASPLLAAQSQRQEDIESAQMRFDDASSRYAAAQSFETNYPEVKTIGEAVNAQFPASADVASLTQAITNAATAAGVAPNNVTSITTSTPTPLAAELAPTPEAVEGEGSEADTGVPAAPAASKIASMEVTISATGSQPALIAFAQNLSNMDRALLVSGFSLTGGTGGEESSLTITATSYLYEKIETPEELLADDVVVEEPTGEIVDEDTVIEEGTPAIVEEGN
jgi:Tfp pilus assembly protein PilO